MSATSVPKGGIEEGETSAQAAAREASEEAGIPTNLPIEAVSPPILTHALAHKPDQRAQVWHVHAVALQNEADLDTNWLEKDERQRKWATPREALEHIREWGGEIGSGKAASLGADESEMQRGGKKKKAIKGDAFEVALTAFARIYGWDKK